MLGQNYLFLASVTLLWLFGSAFVAEANPSTSRTFKETAFQHFENYCFDCHDGEAKKGDLDLANLLGKGDFDGSLIFEHLITAKMPPNVCRPSSPKAVKIWRSPS